MLAMGVLLVQYSDCGYSGVKLFGVSLYSDFSGCAVTGSPGF